VNEPASRPLAEWPRMILRGVGQVMFQGHALSGLLFLLGIAAASPLMAAGGLAGASIGTVLALLLKWDEDEVRDGIYGFNATLVGVAAFFFLKPVPLTIALLIAGAAAATLLTLAMRRRIPFPTYTTPFIVTTWGLLAIATLLNVPRVELPPPPGSLDIVNALTEGLSEVFLQANRITGIFFLAALAVSNWRHAVLGFLGSIVGSLVALYHSDLAGTISIGIYGYNGTLAAIALYLWRKSLLIPLLGIIISTPITEFFPMTGLATLTAPFVLSCWAELALGSLERAFCGEQPRMFPWMLRTDELEPDRP
jgi:urea transporter